MSSHVGFNPQEILAGIGTRFLKHLNRWEREVARMYFSTDPIPGEYLFDVPLIRPSMLEYVQKLPPSLRRQWLYLTAWKIDAVCITDDYHVIIEFKNYATERVIGQLTLYDKLYREQYRPDKPVRWLVACRVIKREVLEMLQKLGIEVRVYGQVI